MNILITSGPTREALDPVRFLSNPASGRMGYALALAAQQAGHNVTLVCGPSLIAPPSTVTSVPVTTTADMLAACLHHWPQTDGVIMAAAPCDFRPRSRSEHKLKKAALGGVWTLELERAPDILLRLSQERKAGQWLVGFALETQNQEEYGLAKLKRKGLDAIVINTPSNFVVTSEAQALIVTQSGLRRPCHGSKDEIAAVVIEIVEGGF